MRDAQQRGFSRKSGHRGWIPKFDSASVHLWIIGACVSILIAYFLFKAVHNNRGAEQIDEVNTLIERHKDGYSFRLFCTPPPPLCDHKNLIQNHFVTEPHTHYWRHIQQQRVLDDYIVDEVPYCINYWVKMKQESTITTEWVVNHFQAKKNLPLMGHEEGRIENWKWYWAYHGDRWMSNTSTSSWNPREENPYVIGMANAVVTEEGLVYTCSNGYALLPMGIRVPFTRFYPCQGRAYFENKSNDVEGSSFSWQYLQKKMEGRPEYGKVFSIAQGLTASASATRRPEAAGYAALLIEELPRIAPFLQAITQKADMKVHVSKKDSHLMDILRLLGVKTDNVLDGPIYAKSLFVPAMSGCESPNVFHLRLLSRAIQSKLQQLGNGYKQRVILLVADEENVDYKEIYRKLKDAYPQEQVVLFPHHNAASPSAAAAAAGTRNSAVDDLMLFHAAKMVIAGPLNSRPLANIVACRKDTVMVQIFPNALELRPTYLALASSLEIRNYAFNLNDFLRTTSDQLALLTTGLRGLDQSGRGTL